MSEFYNELYSTPEVFDQELDSINDLSDHNRGVVAAALAEVWSKFEAEFGDGAGFKQASAKMRTRFRLDLLQKTDALTEKGMMLEARGVRMLALYVRSISHVRRVCERHMSNRMRSLLEADLRHRVLVTSLSEAMQSAPIANTTRH